MASSSSCSLTESEKRKKLSIGGCKINRSENPVHERQEIKQILSEHKEHLESHRIASSKSLLKAEWDPDLNEAKVTKSCGSCLNVFGHGKNRFTYLYPEEALYLVEMNNLELFSSGIRLSLQRCYSMLLNSKTQVSIDQYRIFKHFCIQGYKVFRHEETAKSEGVKLPLPLPLEERTYDPAYGDFCKTLQIFSPIVEDEVARVLPRIYYDVYLPQASFRKTRRPSPDYVLSIVDFNDDILEILEYLSTARHPNVLFASVSENSVLVFNVKGVQIPNLF